jgi:hypothetical protein
MHECVSLVCSLEPWMTSPEHFYSRIVTDECYRVIVCVCECVCVLWVVKRNGKPKV